MKQLNKTVLASVVVLGLGAFILWSAGVFEQLPDYCPPNPPTPTPWPIQPTYTPYPPPEPTDTPTPIPADTPTPTQTNTPTPTCPPTATLAPNSSPTPYPTYTPCPLPGTPTNTPPVPTNTPTPISLGAFYVATNGDDSNPGTEAQPFRTINKGVDILAPGDTLYVKSGTYAEALGDFPSGTSWDAPVTIAAYPGNTVVIRPSSGSWVVRFRNGAHHVILDGFILDAINMGHNVIKLTDGSHHIRIQNVEAQNSPKTGISVATGSHELIGLDIHDCGTTDFDHGIYVMNADNLIQGCQIHHNAGKGIQVYDSGAMRCNNNVIRGNIVYDNAQAGDRGKGILLSCGTNNVAYNNLLWGNNGGVAIHTCTDCKALNNTIWGNNGGRHDSPGILVVDTASGTRIQNNIVYENSQGGIDDSGAGTVQDHNLVDVDPKFVDASAHDFHLQSTSPAIDAGITLSQVPDDFDGVSRPRGTGYDIGAYEF